MFEVVKTLVYTSGKVWLNMQYTCRIPPRSRSVWGGPLYSEYFLEFFSYDLQILHESNTSMKTCLSEKINVISTLKKFLETFEKKVSRQKVNVSSPYEHLEISEFVEF